MKILVVGSGGREHALVWKVHQSPQVSRVYCAPGNGGTAEVGDNVAIAADDISSLADFAAREEIDLTVVGPELPLTLGIVDHFEERGLRIFGAKAAAAEIEGSKVFAKELMRKYGIPTADYEVCQTPREAEAAVGRFGAPVVVKADGLAAGKGVLVCRALEEARAAIRAIMSERAFGAAGERVVVEEYLRGEEASFLAFTDGEAVLPMLSSQDHKPIYDEDRGPNTGGMGAYSPAPVVGEALHDRIMQEIIIPTVRALASEGRPYRGVLYAGLMIHEGEPKVLEFNARFGDPEAQPILTQMRSDLVPILNATMDGALDSVRLDWRVGASVCVVMASEGYPGSYAKGLAIRGLDAVHGMEGVVVFHAGTTRRGLELVTSGGRVLGVTAWGATIAEAISRAYGAVEQIHWDGVYYRRDIGHRALPPAGAG